MTKKQKALSEATSMLRPMQKGGDTSFAGAEAHLLERDPKFYGQTFCDKYGYPIPVSVVTPPMHSIQCPSLTGGSCQCKPKTLIVATYRPDQPLARIPEAKP